MGHGQLWEQVLSRSLVSGWGMMGARARQARRQQQGKANIHVDHLDQGGRGVVAETVERVGKPGNRDRGQDGFDQTAAAVILQDWLDGDE